MPPLQVVLDTNVLIPPSLRDLLLNLATEDLYFVQWQKQILEEMRRNLIEQKLLGENKADKLIAALQNHFSKGMVGDEYKLLEPQMTNDPKDRHVLAAAVASGSQVIVTFNLKDFPPAALAPHNIQAQLPDTFLTELFNSDRATVVKVIQEQAANLKNPPLTVSEVLDVLAKHAPGFVALVRQELGSAG